MNLVRFVYVSKATSKYDEQLDLGRILQASRRNNPREEIGGVLYSGNGYFFQVLEGDRHKVNALYRRLLGDPRHADVDVISVKPLAYRIFSDWSMKYVPAETDVERLLKRFGYKQFMPYDFDEEMVDALVNLFAGADDPTGGPDLAEGVSAASRLSALSSLVDFFRGRR